MDEKEALEKTWELWTGGRRAELPALLEGDGDATAILRRYLALQGQLYWKRSDLEAALAISRFGLAYARKAGNREAENVLLFNVATFTLPWWYDSLPATSGQRDEGLEASQRLLALRKDLGKGPADLSKVLWVLGAHHYVRGDPGRSVVHFNAAVVQARAAGDKGLEACALEGLCRARIRLVPGERAWGLETLSEAKALYEEAGDEYNRKELEAFESRVAPAAPGE